MFLLLHQGRKEGFERQHMFWVYYFVSAWRLVKISFRYTLLVTHYTFNPSFSKREVTPLYAAKTSVLLQKILFNAIHLFLIKALNTTCIKFLETACVAGSDDKAGRRHRSNHRGADHERRCSRQKRWDPRLFLWLFFFFVFCLVSNICTWICGAQVMYKKKREKIYIKTGLHLEWIKEGMCSASSSTNSVP